VLHQELERNDMPPGFMLLQLLFLLLPVGAGVFFGWLGLRFVRARELEAGRRGGGAKADDVARLEDAVLSLQSEVQSIRERQEFVEKLLDKPRPQ
jgi:hypothetical protein